ncbi:unnamed protein product [Taenia asiatica]|uniref:CCDC34 domain-containing protein n=1 Tax=Taenia asiatica TaxID=60517 RepID=A0A0R3WCR4_TAEAS|nr:unnamed protein product [Taenia asiatica]
MAPYIRKTSSKVFKPQGVLSSNLNCDESDSSVPISLEDRNNDGVHPSPLQKQPTPWERWMAKKEAERDKATHELAKVKAQKESKRLLEEEKRLERKRIERAKVQEWIEKKSVEAMKQKKLSEIAKLEQKAEATKKKAQQIRSKEKYQEWLNKKRQEEQMENRRCEEERYLRGLTQQEKRRQAEASFQAWLRSHKVSATTVNRRSPHTYCISDGMLVSLREPFPEPMRVTPPGQLVPPLLHITNSMQSYTAFSPSYSLPTHAFCMILEYFDRTSAPEPEFFNKKSWIS